MVSPTLREREPSPECTTPSDRVIDVGSESPALMRGASGEMDATEDAVDEEEDYEEVYGVGSAGLTELDLSEHEYRHGRQAIPMQSPGDELEIDLDVDEHGAARDGRRRRRLPSLRSRQLFEGDDASFARPSRRGRMMQRITFRRRKGGEMDTFWTGVFISNLLSLALMSVLMFYLLQTDFFESHQSDLFGTTVDNRFTVVSPESTDAKIYMKSGYSTSRYSEAMIAFGNGELKIGRRALATTDVQGFYGLSIANNGSTTFTNKLNAPFVKTDYLHAVRAIVFDDGTAMTTAANLSGGINEVGDVNLNSKTGSITMSAGGKPVLKVDPDATVNLLNAGEDDMESAGISFDSAGGDISIASTFNIHHDSNATVVSSMHPLEFNSTKLVVGSANSSEAVITVASMTDGDNSTEQAVYKKMTLAITGQSSVNQSHGGDVIVSGGDGTGRGGDVVLVGGESTDREDGYVAHGSIFINAKLERTTLSTTEIGSHSKSHKVNLHGSVSINNATDSGHGTSLYVGGGSLLATSKNFTINNLATNGSTATMNSHHISLETSSTASLSMNENATRLAGSKNLLLTVGHRINSSDSASFSVTDAGRIELNASQTISLNAVGANSSISVNGAVRFGEDQASANDSDSFPDMAIEDGSIAIDADSLVVGAAGNTDVVALMGKDISIGNSTQKSSVRVAGENASILTSNVRVGTAVSSVAVTGKEIFIHGQTSGNDTTAASLSIGGSSLSMKAVDVTIGDKNAKLIVIGSSSSDRVAIASSTVVIGASAKVVSVGEKATTVKIGSETTTIEIKGKVTLNGKALDTRRRLDANEATFFALFGKEGVMMPLPGSADEVHVPVHLKMNSGGALVGTSDGDFELVGSSDRASGSHLRMGLTLDRVRWRFDSDTAMMSASKRLPKLRCRVYNLQEPPSVVLEAVSQLEMCEDDEDCHTGFFLGASQHKIVSVQVGERLSLRCAASPTSARSAGLRMVLIDSIQVDISSLA